MTLQEHEDLLQSMGGNYTPEFFKVLHSRKFKEWVEKKEVTVLDSIPESELRVGDTVTYTNSYGVVFPNNTVLGFCPPSDFLPENRVYLDFDCYWSPTKLSELTKE